MPEELPCTSYASLGYQNRAKEPLDWAQGKTVPYTTVCKDKKAVIITWLMTIGLSTKIHYLQRT